MSNKKIDNIYSYALNNGAIGGKLIGAGGGGFLMFWSKNNEQFKKAMKKRKLKEIEFKFEEEGVKNLNI